MTWLATLQLVAGVAVGGLVVGALTAIGQGVLPDVLAPMANSAGSWCAAAFALAALALSRTEPRTWLGAVLAAVALFAMVIGYALWSELSGNAAGSRLILFWGAAAVVVGPAVGAAAAWFRAADPTRVAVAAGVIAGILAGEAAYGLTVIAATTPAAYWAAQLALGLGIAGYATTYRLHARHRLLCLAVTAAIASAVLLVYVANPIQYLSRAPVLPWVVA